MSCCVYDNPSTRSREAWQDGRLVCAVQARVLLGKGFSGGSWFPFMLNVGEWEAGRIVGDPGAIGGVDRLGLTCSVEGPEPTLDARLELKP